MSNRIIVGFVSNPGDRVQVSQGRVVRTSDKHVTSFGLRNGSFVVGYLTPQQIRDTSNPFQVGRLTGTDRQAWSHAFVLCGAGFTRRWPGGLVTLVACALSLRVDVQGADVPFLPLSLFLSVVCCAGADQWPWVAGAGGAELRRGVTPPRGPQLPGEAPIAIDDFIAHGVSLLMVFDGLLYKSHLGKPAQILLYQTYPYPVWGG